MAEPFSTTADEVLAGIDLTGRRVVVTGATSGLGLASATSLARAGADVVLVGRDPARLAWARDAVDAAGPGSITAEVVDLADLVAVGALADRLASSLEPVDVLILNAGVMASPLQRSPQGHEMQLGVSHLSHHVLTVGLERRLTGSGARVVTLSSSGHWLGGFDFDDPDFTSRPYDKWAAYAQAKTATALFAIEVAARLGRNGVVAAAVHPGVIKTDLQRHLGADEEAAVLRMSEESGEIRSVEAGAASIVWAATAAEVVRHNGCYVANGAVANEQRAPHASSPDDAARLWVVTEKLLRR